MPAQIRMESIAMTANILSHDLSKKEQDQIESLEQEFKDGNISVEAYIKRYPKSARKKHRKVWTRIFNVLRDPA